MFGLHSEHAVFLPPSCTAWGFKRISVLVVFVFGLGTLNVNGRFALQTAHVKSIVVLTSKIISFRPMCRANGLTHIPKQIKNDTCWARSWSSTVWRPSIQFILVSFLSHQRMVKLRETMLFVDVVVCLEHDLRVKWSATWKISCKHLQTQTVATSATLMFALHCTGWQVGAETVMCECGVSWTREGFPLANFNCFSAVLPLALMLWTWPACLSSKGPKPKPHHWWCPLANHSVHEDSSPW